MRSIYLAISAALCLTGAAAQQTANGDGSASISGELKQWHKVTLTLDGPHACETGGEPNPFLDYRMTVTFAHESGSPRRVVPGYFAADGAAAESSADCGTKWRAHVSPDKPGQWSYAVSFVGGKGIAVDAGSRGGGARSLRWRPGRVSRCTDRQVRP